MWLEALVLVMSVAVAAIINEKRGLKPGIYYQHRAARGFANLVALSWLATAAFVGAAAAAVAMLLLFTLWLPITIASFVGTTVLLWRGWLPPSAAADVTLAATIDEFLSTVSGTPTRSTGSEPDPWHFNDDHDPHLRLDREHLAELRRSNDLYERDLNGNRTAAVTAPQVAASVPQKRTAAPLAFIAAGALIVVVGAYLWGMRADVPQPAQWPEIHAEAQQ